MENLHDVRAKWFVTRCLLVLIFFVLAEICRWYFRPVFESLLELINYICNSLWNNLQQKANIKHVYVLGIVMSIRKCGEQEIPGGKYSIIFRPSEISELNICPVQVWVSSFQDRRKRYQLRALSDVIEMAPLSCLKTFKHIMTIRQC